MKPCLLRRAVAEFVGTLFLLATVVGSGIMGEKLAGGNVAIALLANTSATGAALIALIFTFGSISGGGVATAHAMFGLPLYTVSTHIRSGPAQVFIEFVATFGLLAVIWGCVRHRPAAVPFAVGAYITAAYWFTASTSSESLASRAWNVNDPSSPELARAGKRQRIHQTR